jgi:hypothetical protein
LKVRQNRYTSSVLGIRKVGGVIWSYAKKIFSTVFGTTLNLFKRTHYHIAHKPHQRLLDRWRWYMKWHQWDYHSHIHLSILAVYSLVVLSLVVVSYNQMTYAADTSDSWDFTTESDFSFDPDKIETSGTSARLKAQNYQDDVNTKALYHLDESGGAVASDSSSNNNNGDVLNATFGVGNLNNGLSFNGLDSKISVPHSSSLALSQSNTLEGWTKFNTAFSAGSNSQRQTVFDKGDYQLYYDNETGRVTYEMADAAADSWSQVAGNNLNGGWDYNGKRSVNALVQVGSDVYAGIGYVSGTDIGDAEVWKWDGSVWTLVGGGVQSVNSSWDALTYEGVFALATDGTNVYAGLGITAGDSEVWMFNGTNWQKIGGDSLNNSWTNYSEQVWSMDYYNGNLYAGIGSSRRDAEVWEWNGTAWNMIGGDGLNSSWNNDYEIVGAITNDGTNLYAGLGTSAGDSEVWMWNGSTWVQIGGDSLNSSWSTTNETVRSLRYFGGTLYAGLGDSAGDADVWSWNGSSWTQIGGDGLNSSWSSSYEQVGSFAYDGANLYAGLGVGNGDGEVWMWNGSSWSNIGGDGVNNSWITNQGDTVNTMLWDGSQLFAGTYDSSGSGWVYTWNGSTWTIIGGNHVNKSWGYYYMSAVQVMQTVGDYLYAGLGNLSGSAQIWRWNESTWEMVGGQGINNSWAPNTYEQIMSMASYKGNLVVGLGTTANTTDNDGEVWEFNGSTWTQIGGDGVNSSWPSTSSHYGEVESMAADDTYLYAGLGLGSNDGEVWRYDGVSWDKIGGDSLNSGWTTYAENIYSMAIRGGNLIVGLGRSTGDGEVWEWDGSLWTRIGGDGVSGSWSTSTYQSVESMVTYGDDLYVGMGYVAGSGVLWKYDGTTWTEVGGDDINGSWTTGTYEKVKTLAVYNGALFAGLGNSTGDGEVWRLKNDTWTKLAGNGINNGWAGTIEEVESFSPYRGKLYAGTGLSAYADPNVWSWGNNAFLQSSTDTFDTNWHHVAATYDGATMKINIDGTMVASKTVNVTMPNSNLPLLIGTSYAGREYGKAQGYFDGDLDELRISDIARTNLTINPYSNIRQTISLADAVFTSGIESYTSFDSSETTNGGSITYRLSDDDGTTWKYWDGSDWTVSDILNNSNPVSEIDSHISTFPTTFYGIKWQAVLLGDGDQPVYLNSVTVHANTDLVAPDTNASNILAFKTNGGSSLATNDWTNGSSPYFSWDAGSDVDSDILGYCLYLGTDDSADPVTTKGLLGNSPINTGGNCQFIVSDTSVDFATAGYIATPLSTSSSPYYLVIKAIDTAGNTHPTTTTFQFRFDNTPPSNPGFISAPSGFINTKTATFTWPTAGGEAASDGASGVAGLQYRINSSSWYGDVHDGSGGSTDLLANDGVYTTIETPDFSNINEGANIVYFRTWDIAGNITTSLVSAALKVNTNGSPSEPQNLTADPTTNTLNSFSFSWNIPETFVGDQGNLNYCYTINTLPSVATCHYTGPGITSLPAGPYATQPGVNTMYVVARDESSNINYDSYTSVEFTANTSAPGIAGNIDIVDVSIKSTSNWRLAITWDEPIDTGVGISAYKIYRSTDDVTYNIAGTSSSTTYIDAGLSQQDYYYYVTACDSTNNCSADSPSVSMLPTGKFIVPADLIGEPSYDNVTTTRAQIKWTTDRGSDSKVLIGTSSGEYSPSEIGSSNQVSVHEVSLDNLAAGTTYYYQVKWTDEDGNTGTSQEYAFTTKPAPIIKEVSAIKVGLSDAIIQFTSVGANKVSLYYGESDAFGGLQSINTSFDETTYEINLTGLKDGTKYFYQLSGFDEEGYEYKGNVFSFTTPPRPRISNLRFQPVAGEPTSTQSVTWTTNVPATSTITYGKIGTSGTDVLQSKLVTSHSVVISGLDDDSEYFLIAQSRDAGGNLAVSDQQTFKTALDTRPPNVFDINIESSIRGTGSEARGQVIISWKTDEPSTSQVGYADGSAATVFNNKTSEDSQMTTEHIVVLSNLPTSQVYSVQVMSYDKARNIGLGEPQAIIIGRANESVLTIILSSLQRIFGL